ncbi:MULTISPECIES: peroxiredoxin [Marichromatium]|uniref:thioredoxin-dependent peroxiredoxin n=1 Tax=Marichromatium gracile TaxID=1048 RepID=A0A4R4ADA7_MARGR|nr:MULTISPECIES: peroxiredoxin [Marichromatium]MBK1709735.1 peroxiredoxin [Marichromatium gracile]MBO8087082.1 peroxiredoxin [Marichromatium sp.]RNE91472.1 peroxiredoxin [Marichromatium sp. AB31]TCW37061.1 peroxiredoxin Q/BCP [Marichromatium gracile]
MSIAIGDPVPDLELTATGDQRIRLTDYRGRNLVLYFYPRASTPGCTQEGLDFAAAHADFGAADTLILGVSRDGLRAQQNFKTKQSFPFELIADTDEQLCRAFDVIKLKTLYGRESLGIERSTFLIDATGTLVREWRKVKVKGHVDEVLEAARGLAQ